MKSNTTTIYLVRHGESENNVLKIVGADPHLTVNGVAQAEAVKNLLSNVSFDTVFASDLLRAGETATVIVGPKRKIIKQRALRERNYGIYEGVSMEKYQEDMKAVLKNMETMSDEEIAELKRHEGFETDKELMSRFMPFLHEVIRKYKGKTILFVTHGILMRTFLVHIGHVTYKQLPSFGVDNTAYIHLECDENVLTVQETNGVNIRNSTKQTT